MNCITTDNLNISYGSLDIVKNLNLKIPKLVQMDVENLQC